MSLADPFVIHLAGDGDYELVDTATGVVTSVESPPAAVPPATSKPQAPGGMTFEDAEVADSLLKLTGTMIVETHGQIVGIDDVIRVVGAFRVAHVNHGVDKKDGTIVRIQIASPAGELELVPWNPADPSDMGILRARP